MRCRSPCVRCNDSVDGVEEASVGNDDDDAEYDVGTMPHTASDVQAASRASKLVELPSLLDVLRRQTGCASDAAMACDQLVQCKTVLQVSLQCRVGVRTNSRLRVIIELVAIGD
jgi:hypothetical protein